MFCFVLFCIASLDGRCAVEGRVHAWGDGEIGFLRVLGGSEGVGWRVGGGGVFGAERVGLGLGLGGRGGGLGWRRVTCRVTFRWSIKI